MRVITIYLQASKLPLTSWLELKNGFALTKEGGSSKPKKEKEERDLLTIETN